MEIKTHGGEKKSYPILDKDSYPPLLPAEKSSCSTTNLPTMSSPDSSTTTTEQEEVHGARQHDVRLVTATEEFYNVKHSRSLKILVLLCCGIHDLNNHNKPLIDFKDMPWSAWKVSSIKPSAADFRAEILRRAKLFGIKPEPRPKAWPVPKLTEWLEVNPIATDEDVQFLRATVASEKIKLTEAVQSASAEADILTGKSSWIGKIPYLRLIHSLVDDDTIKGAFLHRTDIPSARIHLDNQKSVNKRPKTVWEMLAAKWNDPDFSPATEEIPDLHSDFVVSQVLTWSSVESLTPATPEKCQEKFASMGVKLKRIIANWERSGQGDGGILHDDEGSEAAEDEASPEGNDRGLPAFGSLNNRRRGALDHRCHFVDYNQSYLLYLWHMLDKHSLLQSSIQRLDDSVAASNAASGVPQVIDVDASSMAKSMLKGSPGEGVSTNFKTLFQSIASLADAAKLDAQAKSIDRQQEREQAEALHQQQAEAQ